MPTSASKEQSLILSKSLSLIEKTIGRVAQIDAEDFPTESSTAATELLHNTLQALSRAATSPATSPEALYNALIRFQLFVEEVEASNSDHVSWPLVSYCDHIWHTLFPQGDRKIFYSVTTAHNYTISSFTHRLKALLQPVLSKQEIATVVGTDTLYSLQVASLEEENLPLYANIGHEFGHVVYWSKEPEAFKILVDDISGPFAAIGKHLQTQDASSATRRAGRTEFIIRAIAVELFCDLVGVLIAGPAFLLSLQEMGWGTDQLAWTGTLLPTDAYNRGYPSFSFRIHCLKQWAGLATYETDAARSFQKLDNADLKTLVTHGSQLPSDHSADYVTIFPDSDQDQAPIRAALRANLAL